MKSILTLVLVIISSTTFSQKATTENNSHKGEISWGVRTTGSLFSESGNYFGVGAGYQIRYRVTDKLGTEWFADWITTDLGGLGQRIDAHIGVSAMIYPGKTQNKVNNFTPYILGGFCGDYTKIESNLFYSDEINGYNTDSKDRWSFATQLGFGTHYNITRTVDISLSTQYILHFGEDIHSEVEIDDLGNKFLHIHHDKAKALEGHFFITLSANILIIDLLKTK
jgi:opacity protein-like surface antigen